MNTTACEITYIVTALLYHLIEVLCKINRILTMTGSDNNIKKKIIKLMKSVMLPCIAAGFQNTNRQMSLKKETKKHCTW